APTPDWPRALACASSPASAASRRLRSRLGGIIAQHVEEFELGVLRQKLLVPAEPLLLIGQLEVPVEMGACGPVFIKVEHVGIVGADVEVIIDASRLSS